MEPDAALTLVEVCVGSVADAKAAVAAGADRVELCAALELGGLTPSEGLVETVLKTCSVPVVVMLRPRAGGFCYDRHEFEAMLRDGRRFIELGASGLAFGVLDANGDVDEARSQEVVQLAEGRAAVFHRAIDFVRDQRKAIESLAEMGCTRVLTSGGKPTAEEGAEAIRALVDYSAGRIEVMAGGRIRAENVVDVVRRTLCRQVHLGAGAPRDDASASNAAIELCDRRYMEGASHRVVCGEAVSAVVATLRCTDRQLPRYDEVSTFRRAKQ